MKKIVITNNKGGVGKTATAVTIASLMMERGYKVVLIDSDSQGNSTKWYDAKIYDVNTLYDMILTKEQVRARECIQHTDNGDIIAGGRPLEDADVILSSFMAGEMRLKYAIEDIDDMYDYCIMDTHTGLNKLEKSALLVADALIIPLEATKSSIDGLVSIIEAANEVKKYNNNLKYIGALVTKANTRTNMFKECWSGLEKNSTKFNYKMYSVPVRHGSAVSEAETLHETLPKYLSHAVGRKAKMKPLDDYNSILDEIISDIG